MKAIRGKILGVLAISLLVMTGAANAALVSIDNGQAVYDSTQNISWVSNANLAATNCFGMTPCYPGGGAMSWIRAVGTPESWIAAMNTAAYLGVSEWRLPTTAQPDGTCSSADHNAQGYGIGCTGSEMGHLYYVDGITFFTPGPFSNVQPYGYWSGTRNAHDNNLLWLFNFSGGYQDSHYDSYGHHMWAVAPGNIAPVPVPGAAWLFGSALGLMGAVRRKISS